MATAPLRYNTAIDDERASVESKDSESLHEKRSYTIITPWKSLKSKLGLTKSVRINDYADYRRSQAASNSSSIIIPHGFQALQVHHYHHFPLTAVLFTSSSLMDSFLIRDQHQVHVLKGRDRRMIYATEIEKVKGSQPPSPFISVNRWIYIPKWKITIISTSQLELKILNVGFEVVSVVSSIQPVLCLDFNDETNELITGGVSHIRVWEFDYRSPGSLPHGFKAPRLEIIAFSTGEWVSKLCIDNNADRIIAAIDNSLMVFDYSSGRRTYFLSNCHQSSITDISFHPLMNYAISASSDGLIKVWTKDFLPIMQLSSESTSSITGLIILKSDPKIMRRDPLILSSQKEGIIKMWNLDTGDCVYQLQRDGECLGMEWIRKDTFLSYSLSGVTIWNLNQFYSTFYGSGSTISHIKRVDASPGTPSRILLVMQDRSMKLLSPVTGANLFTAFPNIEERTIVEVEHDIIAGTIWMLSLKGRISVYSTQTNPIRIVDEWETPAGLDEICCIHPIRKWSHDTRDADINAVYALIGGNIAGQIVYIPVNCVKPNIHIISQAHGSAIISILCCSRSMKLFTLGNDGEIKIWTWEIVYDAGPSGLPLAIKALRIIAPPSNSLKFTLMAYITQFDTLAATLSSNSLKIFNLSAEEELVHNPDDDHVKKVTGLRSLPALNIFASSSEDGSVKIWCGFSNTLLRELQFDCKLSAVSFLNNRGDLLVGLPEKVALVKIEDYFPRYLLQDLMNLVKEVEDDSCEYPVTFDEHLDFWKLYRDNLLKNGKTLLKWHVEEPMGKLLTSSEIEIRIKADELEKNFEELKSKGKSRLESWRSMLRQKQSIEKAMNDMKESSNAPTTETLQTEEPAGTRQSSLDENSDAEDVVAPSDIPVKGIGMLKELKTSEADLSIEEKAAQEYSRLSQLEKENQTRTNSRKGVMKAALRTQKKHDIKQQQPETDFSEVKSKAEKKVGKKTKKSEVTFVSIPIAGKATDTKNDSVHESTVEEQNHSNNIVNISSEAPLQIDNDEILEETKDTEAFVTVDKTNLPELVNPNHVQQIKQLQPQVHKRNYNLEGPLPNSVLVNEVLELNRKAFKRRKTPKDDKAEPDNLASSDLNELKPISTSNIELYSDSEPARSFALPDYLKSRRKQVQTIAEKVDKKIGIEEGNESPDLAIEEDPVEEPIDMPKGGPISIVTEVLSPEIKQSDRVEKASISDGQIPADSPVSTVEEQSVPNIENPQLSVESSAVPLVSRTIVPRMKMTRASIHTEVRNNPEPQTDVEIEKVDGKEKASFQYEVDFLKEFSSSPHQSPAKLKKKVDTSEIEDEIRAMYRSQKRQQLKFVDDSPKEIKSIHKVISSDVDLKIPKKSVIDRRKQAAVVQTTVDAASEIFSKRTPTVSSATLSDTMSEASESDESEFSLETALDLNSSPEIMYQKAWSLIEKATYGIPLSRIPEVSGFAKLAFESEITVVPPSVSANLSRLDPKFPKLLQPVGQKGADRGVDSLPKLERTFSPSSGYQKSDKSKIRATHHSGLGIFHNTDVDAFMESDLHLDDQSAVIEEPDARIALAMKEVKGKDWFPGLMGKEVNVQNILSTTMKVINKGSWRETIEASKASVFLYHTFESDLPNAMEDIILPQIELINDKRWEVRAQIASNLAAFKQKHPEILVALISKLKDDHKVVRQAAQMALATFGVSTKETLKTALSEMKLFSQKVPPTNAESDWLSLMLERLQMDDQFRILLKNDVVDSWRKAVKVTHKQQFRLPSVVSALPYDLTDLPSVNPDESIVRHFMQSSFPNIVGDKRSASNLREKAGKQSVGTKAHVVKKTTRRPPGNMSNNSPEKGRRQSLGPKKQLIFPPIPILKKSSSLASFKSVGGRGTSNFDVPTF